MSDVEVPAEGKYPRGGKYGEPGRPHTLRVGCGVPCETVAGEGGGS